MALVLAAALGDFGFQAAGAWLLGRNELRQDNPMEPPEELEMREEWLMREQVHMWEQEWRGQVDDQQRRERERERVPNEELAILQEEQILGPIDLLFLLLERRHKLISSLIFFWIFERIVTNLVDSDINGGYDRFVLIILILVSLHYALREDRE